MRQSQAVAHADPVRVSQFRQHLLAQFRLAPVEIDTADAEKDSHAVLWRPTFTETVRRTLLAPQIPPRPPEALRPAVVVCDDARRLLRRQQHDRRLPGVAAQQLAAGVDHRRGRPLPQHLADGAHAVAAERRQIARRQPGDDNLARFEQLRRDVREQQVAEVVPVAGAEED
jgi:hypothetical protein